MSSSPSDWASLRALTGRERMRLAGAAILLPISLVLVKVLGYRRTLRLGERLTRERELPPDAATRVATTTRLVNVADGRLRVPGTCLSRSLVLWFLLRRQGVPTTIRIGVRSGGLPLDAHAWVEHEGRPLNSSEHRADSYAVLHAERHR